MAGGGPLRMLHSGGVPLLGGSVFQGVVKTLEDAMETFLFKVQGIYDSVF